MTTEPTPKSNREQLADIMQALQEEHTVAAGEFLEYLQSTEGTSFREQLEETRQRTIPDSPLDQTLVSMGRLLDSIQILLQAPQAAPNPQLTVPPIAP